METPENPALDTMRQIIKEERLKVLATQRQVQKYRQLTSLCLGLYLGFTVSRYPSVSILAIYLLICLLLRIATCAWTIVKYWRQSSQTSMSIRGMNVSLELLVKD
jgi:uncharacterized membrane protein HdeD (DUF308 family)